MSVNIDPGFSRGTDPDVALRSSSGLAPGDSTGHPDQCGSGGGLWTPTWPQVAAQALGFPVAFGDTMGMDVHTDPDCGRTLNPGVAFGDSLGPVVTGGFCSGGWRVRAEADFGQQHPGTHLV